MRILLLAVLLFGPFLDARRGPRIHPRRVQNSVVSRLRKILSKIEVRGIDRDNQTHVELQRIKDGMTEIEDTLKEIKNATKEMAKTTETPESDQSEHSGDYSLGTFTFLGPCLILSMIDFCRSVSFFVCSSWPPTPLP